MPLLPDDETCSAVEPLHDRSGRLSAKRKYLVPAPAAIRSCRENDSGGSQLDKTDLRRDEVVVEQVADRDRGRKRRQGRLCRIQAHGNHVKMTAIAMTPAMAAARRPSLRCGRGE